MKGLDLPINVDRYREGSYICSEDKVEEKKEWGHGTFYYELDKEHFDLILKGNVLVLFDGEYVSIVKLKKEQIK